MLKSYLKKRGNWVNETDRPEAPQIRIFVDALRLFLGLEPLYLSEHNEFSIDTFPDIDTEFHQSDYESQSAGGFFRVKHRENGTSVLK